MIKIKASYETPEERTAIMSSLDENFRPVSVKNKEGDARNTLYILARIKENQ